MHEVILPKLGLTMEEGSIVRWLKAEGDSVEKGEVLFEVQTDKVVMEVESPASGLLGKILVGEDETVPIAQVIAYITEPEEEIPKSLPEATPAGPVVAVVEQPRPSVWEAGPILATPAARRLARDEGIDLRQVRGTGKKGMIVKGDVLAVMAGAQEVAPAAEEPGLRPKASPAAAVLSVVKYRHVLLIRDVEETREM